MELLPVSCWLFHSNPQSPGILTFVRNVQFLGKLWTDLSIFMPSRYFIQLSMGTAAELLYRKHTENGRMFFAIDIHTKKTLATWERDLMVHMFTLMKGRVGEHIYACLQAKIYSRNVEAIWGNTAIPCTGKKIQMWQTSVKINFRIQ